MRYLYYIAGFIVVFSALATYGLINTRVEISKPAMVINDRIITQSEIKQMLKTKPYYMSNDEYFDSIITQQLLIQEAITQKINEEESFRRSVEQYYEQSLIKILLDRKLSSLEVGVTDEEIEKYQTLFHSRVIISKFGYKTLDEAVDAKQQAPQIIESDFIDLSDDLKFILLAIEKGETSSPVESGMGVLVYRLDKIIPINDQKIKDTDINQVTAFIRDKKRELLMDAWTRQLKKNAEIWREK